MLLAEKNRCTAEMAYWIKPKITSMQILILTRDLHRYVDFVESKVFLYVNQLNKNNLSENVKFAEIIK